MASDEEETIKLLTRMLDRALQNRELALGAFSDVREGKYSQEKQRAKKPKRKASAYAKRYGAAFRKVAGRFKKKNGSWKSNGFKNAQKAAHKLARRK